MEFKEQKRHDFFSSYNIGKILLFSLIIFLAGVLQSSFFPALSMLSASPDLVLLAVIGFAVYDGERSGAAAGIGGGILVEALGGGANILLFPLFYMLCGYIFGIVSRIFLNRNFISWLLYIIIGISLRGALSLVHSIFTEIDVTVYLILTEVIIPEYFITLICSLPMYFVVRAASRPFHKKIEME
jgi:rod shape-determining protein MreD